MGNNEPVASDPQESMTTFPNMTYRKGPCRVPSQLPLVGVPVSGAEGKVAVCTFLNLPHYVYSTTVPAIMVALCFPGSGSLGLLNLLKKSA